MPEPIDAALLAQAARTANPMYVSGGVSRQYYETVAAEYNRLAAEAARPKVPGWLTEAIASQADAKATEMTVMANPWKAWEWRLAGKAAEFRVLLRACADAGQLTNECLNAGARIP